MGYDGSNTTNGGMIMEWIIGAAGSILIAGAAYWKKALSASGAAAAVGVGTCLYALGSLVWYGLMIGFFVSSTLLTKWKKQMKREAEAKYQKSGRRDAGQVLANGGAGTLLCIFYSVQPSWTWLLAAYVGVMATVTADTWATEVGGLSKGLPRSILTWRKVAKGTSGGVSTMGWLASAAGGCFIGVLVCLFAVWEDYQVSWLSLEGLGPIVFIGMSAVAGWIGANVDSVLGATVQAVYRCTGCGEEVESQHHCSKRTTLIRGWKLMDNDAVNLVSSLSGGLIMALLVLLIGP
jgi:uncharacterized protein (TIGR00297 family)